MVTTHLTRDELQRWWEHGAPAERARIIGHLAECDECGALYAEVMDAQPPGVLVTEPVDRQLVQRGYRAYSPRHALGPIWTWPRLVMVGAAAALCLVAVMPLRRLLGPGTLEDAGIRGSTLQALSPIGSAAAPVRFSWSSPVRAARYTVEVRDTEDRPVVVFSSRSQPFELGRDEQSRLQPGRWYTWQVIALDAEGEEMMRAPPQSFVMSPVRP